MFSLKHKTVHIMVVVWWWFGANMAGLRNKMLLNSFFKSSYYHKNIFKDRVGEAGYQTNMKLCLKSENLYSCPHVKISQF